MTHLYQLTVERPDGEAYALDAYRGKVLLIANTASKCGYTPQYAALERLHKRFGARGLVVLGFPCNQFGRQEPGGADEIQSFCQLNFGVTFPIHAKIDVNGADAHPLFAHLANEKRGVFGTKSIKWNFTKFLVDRSGRVVSRHGSRTEPEDLIPEIEALLAADGASPVP